jgi:photosystem II stability/assembly factor-like uncharacterized protein
MHEITKFFSRFLVAFLMFAFFAFAFPLNIFAGGGNTFVDSKKISRWEIIGPSGGDVRVVAIDPRDKNRLYISTLDGQVHTSTDAGKTWSLLASLNRPMLILDQLFVDSRDSNILYTSGNRGKLPGGFFKSTDQGKTWKESKDLRNEAIHAMVQSKTDPNTLYVGTTAGVWISKNSGDDWTKLPSSSALEVDSLAVDPRNDTTLYAGTTWRPYKSTDAGKSWRLVKDGLYDDSDVFAVTLDPRDPSHIIASACSGIYESFNSAEKWAKIQGIPGQSRRTRDIVQHPTIAGTVFAGTTEGFWMSSNGGKSWALTTPRNLEINSIAVHPDEPNRVFIATNNFGVMVSNDGGKNFVQTNDNFTSRMTYSVTADVAQPNRLYAMTQNTSSSGGFFFTSNDGGRTWNQSKSLDFNRVQPFSVVQDRVDPNRMFLGANLGIFRSMDRGETWTLLAPPKPAKTSVKKVPAKKMTAKQKAAAAAAAKKAAEEAAAQLQKAPPAITEKVKVLAFTEDDKNGIFAGTDNGLYRTYDIDKGWQKIDFGNGLNENVFAIYASPLVPGTIWVGTATSGLLVSTDDGTTWSKVDGPPTEFPISSITADPKRPNYLYVGTTQSLYLTRDGGRSWTRRGGNLPFGNYTSILINPNNTDEVYVSSALESDGGIYYSDDAGMKWKRLDSKDMNLPSRRFWAMAFDPADPDRIFAGTHSSGVYRIERIRDTADSDPKSPSVAATNGH